MDSDSQTNWEAWEAEAAEAEKQALIATSNMQPDQTTEASRKRKPIMETPVNPTSPKPLPPKVRLTPADPQSQAAGLAVIANAAITPPPALPPIICAENP